MSWSDRGLLWHTDDVRDEKTRFHLVSVITEIRAAEDARKPFKRSKKVAGKKPRVIVTDGLNSYKQAFNKEFYDYRKSVEHIADVALQESLNNVLERMHGTIREREKVMRGLKVDETPILPLNQIYYNFIRPHLALDGKTPAEVAGVGVDGENKWISLIQKASRKDE